MSPVIAPATCGPPSVLHHVIPACSIIAEEGSIGGALIEGGYDPQDLPLLPLAVEARLRHLRDRALEAGIPILDRAWSLNPNGDAEVTFAFERDADAVMFKIMVL